VADEPRYLNDDNDLATAFAEDVWLFHIPARLASEAVKYFGVPPLSKSVRVEVAPGEPESPLSGELKERFNDSLPYVWTWRSSQSKQDAEKLLVRLKGLKVIIIPTLKASLSLSDVHHKIERRWHVDSDTIYLHKDHANETELSQALAKALGVRSEADFYENLLRCSDASQRKEKLLSKGIADAEIDRCLREYSRPLADEEHDEEPEKQTKGQQGGSSSLTPSNDWIKRPQPRQLLAGQQGDTSEKPSEPHEQDKPSLRLKDPSTIDYVTGSPSTIRPDEHSVGVGGGGGGTEQELRSLTDAERAKLEEAGRAFAARELEKMGFSVEKMPQGNPGFDLLAKKDGDELRVEVKAHSGRATVVELTQREYKEYLGQQGYRWELWNIEHLAEDDSHSVVITRYDQIPDDALDTRTFRVDLKKCQRKLRD